MGLVLGGDTAWKVFRKDAVVLAFHWVQGEPSMVLYPYGGRLMLRKAVPYCLPLSRAHQLVKDGSNGAIVDSAVLWQIATTAVRVMGLGDDFQITKAVADLILNHLDDLCDMPPEPLAFERARRPAPTGEVAFKVDGESVFQGEA
jgi:hypothetical protein